MGRRRGGPVRILRRYVGVARRRHRVRICRIHRLKIRTRPHKREVVLRRGKLRLAAASEPLLLPEDRAEFCARRVLRVFLQNPEQNGVFLNGSRKFTLPMLQASRITRLDPTLCCSCSVLVLLLCISKLVSIGLAITFFG